MLRNPAGMIRGLALLGLAVLLTAPPAAARVLTVPNSPSAVNEWKGAGGGLGSSHRFASAAAATAHCPGDTIVWSNGAALSFVLPGAPGYGAGDTGFYACELEAESAGFSPAP